MNKAKKKFLNKAIDMVDKELYRLGIGDRVTVDNKGFGVRLCDDIYGILIEKEPLKCFYNNWRHNNLTKSGTLSCFAAGLARRASQTIEELTNERCENRDFEDEYDDYYDDYEDEEGGEDEDVCCEEEDCERCGLCDECDCPATEESETDDSEQNDAAAVASEEASCLNPFEGLAESPVMAIEIKGEGKPEEEQSGTTLEKNEEAVEAADENVRLACPRCGGLEMTREGKDKSGVQRYRCKACGKYFSDKSAARV